MQIGTQVFERIVAEARDTERQKAIEKMVDLMQWTQRFGGFSLEYRARCAEILYDNGDCKVP